MIHALGIPAKVAPKTAGNIIATAIIEELSQNKPVVLAVSTNDGLGQNGVNIMSLLKTKHIYFVPFTQDNPEAKPNSIVSEFSLITPTLEQALVGNQLQPVLHQK